MLSSTWNSKGANDKVGANNGRAKIDRFTVDTDNTRLVGKVTADLRQSLRTFTFVHLSLRDVAGHDHRFMYPAYLRAVPQTDRLLGQILATISARPSLRAHTLVIVTADHGGDGLALQGQQARELPRALHGVGSRCRRRPQPVHTLSAGNRPGSKRTSYSGRQPIRNGDLANLATDVLDLPRVLGSQFNSAGPSTRSADRTDHRRS